MQLYRDLLKSNTNQHHKQYYIQRNRLAHITEQAKKEYFSKQIGLSQHDSGLLRKTINDIVNIKQTKSQYTINIKYNEANVIDDPLKTRNKFNDYFASIERQLTSKIHQQTSSCAIT